MNKFIEKHKTKLIILICALVSGIVSVSATVIIFSSSEVSYDNSESGMSSSNVQDAIDELYGVARLSERIDELETELSSVKNDYWKTIYPIGSIYTSIENESPQNLFDGTWEELSKGKVLWTVGSDEVAGTYIDAGLPNITGTLTPTYYGSIWGIAEVASGSFSLSGTRFDYQVGNLPTSNLYKHDEYQSWTFDASKSSSIYGKSSTVQPPAITVHMWKRKA